MRIVILGGIHGAGKTHVASRIAPGLGMLHVTAGSLLRIGSIRLPMKAVRDVDANQYRILDGLETLEKTARMDIILDGHFCLITVERVVRRIPTKFFRRIAPAGIAVLDVEPQLAATRLKAKGHSTWETELLQELRQEELAHAEDVARDLHVPFSVWRAEHGTAGLETWIAGCIADA